jgi:hypothetical protein
MKSKGETTARTRRGAGGEAEGQGHERQITLNLDKTESELNRPRPVEPLICRRNFPADAYLELGIVAYTTT